MTSLAAITFGFASGVFLRSLFFIPWPVYGLTLIVALITLGAWHLTRRTLYANLLLFCLLLPAGLLRADLADTPPPQDLTSQLRHRVSYEGIVVSDPALSETQQRFAIEIASGLRILVATKRGQEVAVGDRVRASGTLTLPEPFETEGGRTFAYDHYLRKDSIRYILNFSYVNVEGHAPWYSPPAFFARIKHTFLEGLGRALPDPYAALAGGLVIGGKSGLGKELRDSFVRSGLIQIVVLSGYNVMIIAEGVMFALAALQFSRRKSAVLGAVAVTIFVLVAGVSATALRALLMALIALYARLTGRTYAASRALLAAILLMLLYNPLLLVFDPGFGLSVVATAGLIWLSPHFEKWLVRIPSTFWRTGIATTLAAQVAVLPLLLYDTGNLSFVAIPANLLALPVVPIAMTFSALAGIGGVVLGSFSYLVGYPAYAATYYLITLAETASRLPLAVFVIPAFAFWVVLLAYGALAYWTWSKRASMTDQFILSKKASM